MGVDISLLLFNLAAVLTPAQGRRSRLDSKLPAFPFSLSSWNCVTGPLLEAVAL